MVWAFNALPALTEQEFLFWQNILEERTGISFERHKVILQTGLGQRMREINCASYDEYYQKVFGLTLLKMLQSQLIFF